MGGLDGNRRTDVARSCPALGTDRPSSTRPERHVEVARSPAGAPPPFRARDRGGSPTSGRAIGPARGEPSNPAGCAARPGSGHAGSILRRGSPKPRPKGRRARTKCQGVGSRCVGSESGDRSDDSTFPPARSGRLAERTEAPPEASRSARPPHRAKPVTGEEVTPGAGRTWDLLGEPCQQMLDLPIRPFEKDLRDQVVWGRIAMLPHETVRGPDLASSVDIENPERNAKALGRSFAVPYGKGYAVRTPRSKDDCQASRPSLWSSSLHAYDDRLGRILGRRPCSPRRRRRRSGFRGTDVGSGGLRFDVP
jgi:hypothetical protein